MVRYGEMWGDMGDVGRYGEIWGDMGRCGEIWGDVGRYGEIWGDMGKCEGARRALKVSSGGASGSFAGDASARPSASPAPLCSLRTKQTDLGAESDGAGYSEHRVSTREATTAEYG